MTTDDFYVGYQPRASPGTRLFIRRAAAVMLLIFLAVAAAAVATQDPFPKAYFGFGVLETHEGTVREDLLLTDAGPFALVGEGKRAARGLPQGRARITGQRIERDGVRMLEVARAEPAGGAAAAIVETDGGGITLTGEIVDTKCYLGVMNPGQGKLHQDCARHCLRGGIRAGIVAKGKLYFLDGDFTVRAGERVTLTGRLIFRGGVPFLALAAPGAKPEPTHGGGGQ